MSVGSVAKLLAAELRDLKSVERLFLRITCRTAEWPEDLTKCLEKKWPEGATRVLELAPLTRAQVELAATAAGQDPTAFARAVIEKDLVGFARSPLTLRFLLEAWRKEGGSLPISLQELYEEGCHELCSDPRDRSIDPRRDAVPIRHRLLVASHIAAASIFGGRTAIWMDSSNVGRPDGTLSISDLAQGSVTAGQAQVEVTGIQLRVVLDSGLFSSRGENLMGWAHQTYAEFLAARYFRNESLTPAQILDLLTSPMDSDKKLVPQLQETAAWASEPNSPLFNHLSQVQPDALLGSDVATASPEVKAALLKAILDAFIRDDVSADWWTLRRRWPKLSHPGIDSTLRSVLKDRDGPALPRAIAIEIAMACKVGALAPPLTEIALDPTEPADLRREATRAVVDLGDPKSRCALRSMALGQAGPDPDHHLRGIALNACWPDHLTTVELFGSLVPINKFGMGYYRSFLNGKWVSRLTADDMTHALAWVTGIQNLLRAGYDPYDGLEHKALDASLPYLDNPQILQSLVRAILSLIKNGDLNRHGDSPLANRVETDADLRHRMAEIALSILRPPDEHAWILTSGRMPLVCSQDIDWLVQKLIDTPDGPLRCAFADLIQRQHNLEGSSGVESLLLASEADSALVDLLPHWLAPVQLDSAQAKAYRHHYQRHLESERLQRSLSEPITPTRSERISSALASFEAGEVDAWCALCHILECDERGRFDSSGYTWDLRDLTGWKSVSVANEPRLIQAAERYLIKRTAQPERWFANTSSVPSFAFGGLHALAFLGGIAPGKFRALPVEVWIQWMPAILRVPNYGAQDQHQRVVDQAFQRAPTEAEHWTMKILEAVMVDGEGIEILEYIPYTLSPSLGLSLLSMARRGSVQPRLFRRLVRELWRRRVPGLQEWLVECLEIANAIEADHKERTLSICSVLVREGGCHEWPLVREMIRRSDDLGQKVFSELVHINSRTIPRILTESPEQESAELWEWAMKHFPPSTYQPKRGSGQVTDSEQIGEFRNNLL